MYGYLYCFSNKSMPGILKIGITKRTPKITLNKANCNNTMKSHTLYEIEFAKKVLNPKKCKILIHKFLSHNNIQINLKREFFRVSTEEVKTLFDLIDGDSWVKYHKNNDNNNKK